MENCENLRRTLCQVCAAAEVRDRLEAKATEHRYERPLVQGACSACAGDYEDPDRTAATPDEEAIDAEELEID